MSVGKHCKNAVMYMRATTIMLEHWHSLTTLASSTMVRYCSGQYQLIWARTWKEKRVRWEILRTWAKTYIKLVWWEWTGETERVADGSLNGNEYKFQRQLRNMYENMIKEITSRSETSYSDLVANLKVLRWLPVDKTTTSSDISEYSKIGVGRFRIR